MAASLESLSFPELPVATRRACDQAMVLLLLVLVLLVLDACCCCCCVRELYEVEVDRVVF